MKIEKRNLIASLHSEIILSQITKINESIDDFIQSVSGGVSIGYAVTHEGESLSIFSTVDDSDDYLDLVTIKLPKGNPAIEELFYKLFKIKKRLETKKDVVMYALINVVNHCESFEEVYNALPPFLIKILGYKEPKDFSPLPHWYVMDEEDIDTVRKFYFLSKLL